MTTDHPNAATHLHELAETTPDALVTIDTDSRIQYANPAIGDILGYTPDELVGEPLTVLMADPLAERHMEAIDRYLNTGTRRLDWNSIELPGKHQDGHEVPLDITFSEYTQDGEQFFAGVLRDVSRREELKAERDLLHAAVEQVAAAETFSAGLSDVLALIGESMNWVYGEAWVPVDDAGRVELEAAWTADEPDLGEFRAASAETTFESGESLVGRVLESGEYEWIRDASAVDEAAFSRTTAASDHGLKAALGVPILTDGDVVTVLVFLMPEERDPDERMLEATRAIAANLGLLVGEKRAEDALREERNLVSNILETTPTGIAVVDADGELTYLNDQAAATLRLESDEQGSFPPFEDQSYETLDTDGKLIPETERPYRSVLDTGSDVKRTLQVEFPDGDRCWLAVRGTPLRNDAGDVTSAVLALDDVTEQRRRADQLERLNELAQVLSEAESFEEAGERAVTAARDALDVPVAVVRLYDADSASLEQCARTTGADELAGDGSLFGSERSPAWQAFVENDARVHHDVDAVDGLDADETPLGSAIVLPLGKHGVLVVGDAEPNAFSETTVTLAEILAGNTASALDRLDREVALRDRKTELERKNEQLRRVQRVNQEIRNITEALMDADSRDEIHQLVCDELADSEPYRFVWFGERDLATDEVVPVASAGVEEGYLDAVTVTTDADATGQGPAGRAVRTHEAQMQNDIQSDPPFEPWRQEAMERGYRASMAVPVVYQGTLYGLLSLYASESGVFTEMEQAVLAELGEMIGYALNAMERYDALVSEESVELEFVIRDNSRSLLSFLQEHGGRFRLENIRSREGGTLRVFGAFEDISFETVQALVDEHSSSEDVTLVRDRDDETIVELALAGDSFLTRILDRGAMPTAIRATPEEGTVTLRVAKSASVREFVELFEERYEDVELVARREDPDPVQTEQQFERVYLNRLTERQQEVIQTAYFAGFFEQPRENTARDIAEILDVSQPTVSRHIRSGEKKLFSMLFDNGSAK